MPKITEQEGGVHHVTFCLKDELNLDFPSRIVDLANTRRQELNVPARALLLFVTLVTLTASAAAISTATPKSSKTIVLITAETTPFMSPKMKDDGAAIYALRKILGKIGYRVEMRYAPWTRAKMVADKDDTIDGFFPYAARDMDNFIYSRPLSETPWIIVQRKDHPIHWTKLEDLTKYVAGNVTGIELRPGIKELVEQKKLQVESTTTDTYNLLKLATKRVDLVFMDPNVFRFHMATVPELQAYKNILEINPKPVHIDKYGLALKKNAKNEVFLKEFNKVASIEENTKNIEYYLKHMSKEPQK